MDEAYQHSDLTIMPSYTLFTRGFMWSNLIAA